MFRRSMRRSVGRRRVGNIPPALQKANQLMVAGQYTEVAGIYEQLARGAENRNGPRAPWFFLQAGRAHLLSDHVQAGMANIQQGLSILAQRSQFLQLQKMGLRVIEDLTARGLCSEAKQIQDFLHTNFPGDPTQGTESTSEIKETPNLPTNCLGCGGPMRSDEVVWIDSNTAECPYCGSMARAD